MRHFKALIAGTVLAGLVGTAPATAQDSLTEFDLGWLRSSLTLILHPVAVEEGFYKKHGLAPNVTEIRSGDGGVGAQSVMTGDLDAYIGVISDVAKLNSHAKDIGQDPMLTVLTLGSPGVTHLTLQKDIPYESVQDLKGLRIGVTSLGSAHLVTFRRFLSEQGMTVEDLGLELVRVGGSDMPAALVSDQIDGFLHSQPTPSIAVATGEAKVAIAPADMGLAGRSPNLGLIVRKDWLAENRDTAQRIVAALQDASDAYDDIPTERIVEIATQYLGGEPELIAASRPYVNPKMVDLKEGADIYWEVEMEAMKERGEVSADFEQADLFTFDAFK